MSSALEQKVVVTATAAVKELGLQPYLRSAAVILCAEESTRGNSLRNLIAANHKDPDFKALVEDFFTGGGTGKAHVVHGRHALW